MTTFLQKTFLLGAVVASAVSASDCSNMGGFRVGIGLGVANGVSTQKVSTVGGDSFNMKTSVVSDFTTAVGPLLAAPDIGGDDTSTPPTPHTTYSNGQTVAATGDWIGRTFEPGFTAGPLLEGNSGFQATDLFNCVEITPVASSIGTLSRKSNLGKVGLAGALNLEYWMYVGGSALVGFGVDVHNGTGYMTGSKDSPSLVNSGSFPLSTKIKTVWGVTPKLMFGWQLAPRTMLTFSVGASIDKYKTQSTVADAIVDYDQYTLGAKATSGNVTYYPVTDFSGPQSEDRLGSTTGDKSIVVGGPKKFNKTKVGIQLGLGMRTVVAPNVELMIEGKATFGKAIKLTDTFNSVLNTSFVGDPATGGTLTKTNFPWERVTQKFTMQKYELLVGVAYKFGGSDKASAAA